MRGLGRTLSDLAELPAEREHTWTILLFHISEIIIEYHPALRGNSKASAKLRSTLHTANRSAIATLPLAPLFLTSPPSDTPS